jgi:hypothetical protein
VKPLSIFGAVHYLQKQQFHDDLQERFPGIMDARGTSESSDSTNSTFIAFFREYFISIGPVDGTDARDSSADQMDSLGQIDHDDIELGAVNRVDVDGASKEL